MKKFVYAIMLVCPVLFFTSCLGEDLSDLKDGGYIPEPPGPGPVPVPVPAGCVDLGLDVYWAEYNLGAQKPEDPGETYSIGYPLTDQIPSYYDIINTKYDTAISLWGQPWRMPKESEWQQLLNRCTWTYGNKNGVQGFYATGPNGNRIFFPIGATKGGLISAGTISCMFWTGTHSSSYSYSYYYSYLYLYDDDTIKNELKKGMNTTGYSTKSVQLFVRPVQDKQ